MENSDDQFDSLMEAGTIRIPSSMGFASDTTTPSHATSPDLSGFVMLEGSEEKAGEDSPSASDADTPKKRESSPPVQAKPHPLSRPLDPGEISPLLLAEIMSLLDERDRKMNQFSSIINEFNAVSEELVKLRMSGRRDSVGPSSSVPSSANDAILDSVRQELSEVYRNKSINDQELLDTKRALAELNKQLQAANAKKDEIAANRDKLIARNAELETQLHQVKEDRDLHRDERFALQAHVQSLTERGQQLETERLQLLDRIRDLQEKQAAFFNTEIEHHSAIQQERIRREIAAAVADGTDDDLVPLGGPSDMELLGDTLPMECSAKIEANEGEVTALCWLDSTSFAVGGSDKMVRIYRSRGGKNYDKTSNLVGCNQTVTRLDWNAGGRLLLASSNDHTARLWNIDTGRLMYTLSGHTDKVSSARFLEEHHAVTGSYDRSLKLFDVRQSRAMRSYWPGSTILDIACVDSNNFVSGHFNKTLRLWDTRQADSARTIELSGKVCGLEMGFDRSSLLCSLRDDTLVLLELRMYNTLHLYSADSYHSSTDLARCTLSPGGEYVAAGSADGPVYVWKTSSTKLEKRLSKGGHTAAVQAVAWSPSGHGLLSSDKMKNVCVWS